MAEVAKLIQRHLPNVLTNLQHGITKAGLEAVNATIQWVKKTARGFRNVEHFKTAICHLFPLWRLGSLSNPHESLKSRNGSSGSCVGRALRDIPLPSREKEKEQAHTIS